MAIIVHKRACTKTGILSHIFHKILNAHACRCETAHECSLTFLRFKGLDFTLTAPVLQQKHTDAGKCLKFPSSNKLEHKAFLPLKYFYVCGHCGCTITSIYECHFVVGCVVKSGQNVRKYS